MRAANARVRRGERVASPGAPGRAPEHADRAGRGETLRIEEAVVRDLSHELGNYFHKLYYWTDCIKSGATDPAAGASPSEMLEDLVHRMQDYLNVALEYFQPARLSRVAMSGDDLARAVETLLRGAGGDARVDVVCEKEAAAVRLMVDPTRLSTGLRLAARLLAGPGCSALQAHLRAARADGNDLLEIALTAERPPGMETRPSHRIVEWAVAGRMIELHGGELSINEERQGSAGCRLTLPLAS